MDKLTQEEQKFYDRLYPCIVDRSWQYTGEVACGMVRWWLKLPGNEHEKITATAKAGIVQLPNSSYFFVRIDTIEYPQKQYVQHLDIKPVDRLSTSDRVRQIAQQTAIELLRENAEAIRSARQEWLKELEQMKSDFEAKESDRCTN